ncbi:Gfo/Idh/MocA family oxidoreductase [Paenibacillus sp.]|uniref:Gfo/Idh/MocA family protein n=1 Tax=Paenibacillus sp. TaxID=58172 RepID=UPI002D51978C|nr:Gfo/Idh/MocA family oxidoreductase [Paenibacillus sp.]HZG83637.1 Gfo/Idh/MocA family oxidoreductase [Paenibacillus sp.]
MRIGLIGLGFMGRTHLETYERLRKEGLPVEVVAVCDADPAKLAGRGAGGNIETSSSDLDLSGYAKYTDAAEMLASERLDAVDITLPTFLHRDVTVQCLRSGVHVLCEKPMALSVGECADMTKAAEEAGKLLMVGQCLRFWPAYVYLKEAVANETYGKVKAAVFFRGGSTPTWAAWLTQKEKSGGALIDMHVHDADVVNWLFGKPEAVSCQALNVVPGSGYDIVSTHYRYPDGKVINAQADWTLQGDFGFEMSFRVNCERGNLVFKDGVLTVNPSDASGYVPELSPELGYYFQLKYFVEAVANGTPVSAATPESTMETIAIIEAEVESADGGGAWTPVR